MSTSLIVILVVVGVVLVAGGGFFIFLWRKRLEEEKLAKTNANDAEDPTVELLKKVRKIEIKTKGISKQIFSGEYHSAFKGRGMSFSEVRSYQYGDDVRNIDWNVTARTGDPYIKIFEEERELTAMLLVDVSASDNFGTQKLLKEQLITEICAVLAFSAIQNKDRIGIIFFSDKVEKFIPPKKGKQHILRIIRELIEFEPEHKQTDIGEALRYLNNVVKKRSIVFVLSDFMDESFADPLRIANRKHDVVALRIFDKREKELSNMGHVLFTDPETGEEKWINTGSKKIRKWYAKRAEDLDEYLKAQFIKSGVDHIDLATDESYIPSLMKLFKRRGH